MFTEFTHFSDTPIKFFPVHSGGDGTVHSVIYSPISNMIRLFFRLYTWYVYLFQVGSLSVEAGSTSDGSDHLLVAQGGGTYIPLVYAAKLPSENASEQMK